MAMGILQALKLQEGPIESLAQLPQQQLIAMSQQGRIPADVLPIILNEKAQMAQAAANMQAMQRPMQPSVIEQAMAINAQAEAPQMAPQEMPEDAGVASLPVPDDMYSDEGYAGGGIVAFANGGMSQMESDQAAMLDTLKRLGYSTADIATMIPRGITGAFNTGVIRPARAITGLNIPYAKDILAPEGSDFTSMTPFYDQLRSPKPTSTTAAEFADRKEKEDADTLGTIKKAARNQGTEESKGEGRGASKAAAAPAKEAGIAAIPTKESILDRRRRMLEQLGVTDTTDADLAELEKNRGRLAEDKFDALRMSLIRAGLGMAAGTSPYALSNIAKGGIEGFDTYEQSIKQIKAEEKEYGKLARDLRKEANAVKRSDVDKALDLEYKADLMDIEKKKLAATVRSAEKTPSEIQLIERIQKDPEFAKAYARTQQLRAEPKTRQQLQKEYTENLLLLKKQYPTFEDYERAMQGGSGAVPGVKFLGVR